VRPRAPESGSRAVKRVAEYLRALGLTDATRTEQLAIEICRECSQAGAAGRLPELAIARAQERVQDHLKDVFGADAASVDPLWLRSFAGAFPELFLGDVEAARRAVRRFGDPRLGRCPTHTAFRDQRLDPYRIPRWVLGFAPATLVTMLATAALLWGMSDGGLSTLELVWAGLFSFLFGFAAVGMSVAVVGFATRGRRESTPAMPDGEKLPRSALLMPIYHESAEHVFAALLAMRESLAQTPGGDCFEIFVLSDSRDPEKAADEERAFRRISSRVQGSLPVYYRRRALNEKQKAGNLAEFFERWGHRYTYAVVLDADSLMSGATLVELVRRMHAKPRLALLQAPLELHRGATLFARVQQLANSVSGPLFTRGLAVWAGGQGNYYGHNAVVRVSAFLDCCALPELRGEPPLGGHILSHDFVEAALLCRAGWEVRIAHDLEGSWEELPPTLPEYVARDRRWCQGNLQHVRIALSEGLRPMSRIHMATGVAAYLAGPLWLAFVAVGVAIAQLSGRSFVHPVLAGVLTALTATVLLGPRFLGLLATLCEPARRRAHGGALRLTLSVLLETLLSALVAPLLMLHHTRIVLSILSGSTVRWGAQKRRSTGDFRDSLRAELPTSLLGAAVCAWFMWAAPALLWQVSPLWLPWLLAMPISMLVSSGRVGGWLRRAGLLLTPSETVPSELGERADDLRALTAPDEAARFRDLVLDPVLVATHVARLGDKAEQADKPRADLVKLCQRALRAGPAGLTAQERRALTGDVGSMRFLHREAWRHWPVESWRLSRERPHLPPEPGLAAE
jgi:membrane glycosyltransferase